MCRTKIMFLANLFAAAAVLTVCSSIPPVHYYETLWADYYATSNAWTRPTEKTEWKGFKTDPIEDFGRYDFIILGGGTAGAVLAKRLTKNITVTVLVLEAGVDETEASRIPAVAVQTTNSDKTWGYLTTPQKNACLGMENCKCSLTTAKSLGGGTAVNNMHYIRGNKADYDNWQANGCAGWSYANVLPYFYKSEAASLPFVECHFHNERDHWSVTFPKPQPPLTDDIINANVELGAVVRDYNAAEQIGVFRTEVNTLGGKRHSTNQAFLRGCSGKENVKIVTRSLTTKIEYDKNHKVTSVVFLHNGASYRAYVNLEVIVSLGSVNTPQLLLQSGIGPANDLAKLNIPCGVDLPVGKNFRDQFAYNLYIKTDNCSIPRTTFEQDWAAYINARGILTTPIGHEVAFVDICGEGNGCPDAQFTYTIPYLFNTPKVIKKLENYKASSEKALRCIDEAIIQVTVILLHPKSAGTIKLKSADPLAFPLIDPNYLAVPSDVDDLYDAIQYAKKLLGTNSFKKLGSKLIDVTLNRCKSIRNAKNREICLIRNLGVSGKNPSGSCRMGNDKSESVVNSELKVHGFKNLRIADSSVFPTTISSNENAAAVVMIAEKLADLLMKTHNCM